MVAVLLYLPSIPAVGLGIFLLYAQDFSSIHSLWLKVRSSFSHPRLSPKSCHEAIVIFPGSLPWSHVSHSPLSPWCLARSI